MGSDNEVGTSEMIHPSSCFGPNPLTDCHCRKKICSCLGHSETVRRIEFIDSKKAISASRDMTLKIWDLESGTCRTTFSGHKGTVMCLALGGEVAVSGSYDRTCKVWSLREERLLETLSGHTGEVYAVSIDGVRIVSGSFDQDVRVWDLASGACTAVLRGHTSLVSQIVIQDNELITGGADGRMGVWDLESSELKYAMLAAHDYSVTSIWVQDGHIISGGSDGLVKLWELKTGEVIQELGTEAEAVWKVAFGEAEVRNAVVALNDGAAFLDVGEPLMALGFSHVADTECRSGPSQLHTLPTEAFETRLL